MIIGIILYIVLAILVTFGYLILCNINGWEIGEYSPYCPAYYVLVFWPFFVICYLIYVFTKQLEKLAKITAENLKRVD